MKIRTIWLALSMCLVMGGCTQRGKALDMGRYVFRLQGWR
jgi:hypothetical protein